MIRLACGVSLVVFLVGASFAVLPAAAAENERAYLGVVPRDVPEEVAAHLDIDGGFMVQDVLPGSPAEKAGIKRHDIVLLVDGEKTSLETVAATIQKHEPGDKVKLAIQRGKEKLELEVVLGAYQEVEEPKDESKDEEPGEAEKKPTPPEPKKPGFLGVRFTPVPQVLAEHLGLEAGAGSLIDDVMKGSAADKAGIERNDILLKVDGGEIRQTTAVDAIKKRHAGDKLRLEIIHRGTKKEVEVTLGERPKELSSVFGPRGLIEIHPLLQRGHEDLEQLFHELPRFRGRLLFKDGDGVHELFEFPDWNGGNMEDLGSQIEKQLREGYKNLPEDLQDNVREIHKRLEALLERMGDSSLEFDFDSSQAHLAPGTRHRTAIITKTYPDGYEITVRDEDGRRTVSVAKDGETVAENVPVDELDDLPDPVRRRVERVLETRPRAGEPDEGKKSERRLFRFEEKKPEPRPLKV